MKTFFFFSLFIYVLAESDFDEISQLVESSCDKLTKLNFNTKNDSYVKLMYNIESLLHDLEQGLLSGNEGRMSGLIFKVKNGIKAFEENGDKFSPRDILEDLIMDIKSRLKGDPGWTPSWHFISKFLQDFVNIQ